MDAVISVMRVILFVLDMREFESARVKAMLAWETVMSV